MAQRGKAAATTALVPFECPQCSRDYRVELDFVKMRRLNRIAVCPTCHGRYSLSVRLERSTAPFDPDPYADERHSSVRRVRDARPGRPSQPVTGISSDAPVFVIDSTPPPDSTPPWRSTPPRDSTPPWRSTPPRDSVAPQDTSSSSPPPPHSQPPLDDGLDWTPREERPHRRAQTQPTAQAPRNRQDTEPGDRPPFVVDDSVPPPSDPPLSDRKPTRKSGPRYERTLGGVGPENKPPEDEPAGKGVGVHVIVEVGLVDTPNRRKTTKSYRPEHLVTLPGLGIRNRSPRG